MQLSRLRSFFDNSPAVRLLRATNAPYVADFLESQFKRPGRIAIEHDELLPALAAYQQRCQAEAPEALRDSAENYLNHWSSSHTRWLKRRLEVDLANPVYELTPSTEQVLSFLDESLQREAGFVGTESRLRQVVQLLDELAVGSTDDPQVQLAALRNERAVLDAKIAAIESQGEAERFLPTRIREQFGQAVWTLKHLQADFRAVEENFRELTRQVQQRHSEGADTRGGILGFALDAEEILNQQDEGVSFREFVRLILSPAEQERLQGIVREITQIDELTDQAEGLEVVRRMIPSLMAEANKVMKTHQRLSSTLRRVLDPQASRHRRQIGTLLAEIRGLAAGLANEPPLETVGATVDARLDISSPMARPFWSESERFEQIDLTEHAGDEDLRLQSFRHLAGMQRIDWRGLRQKIDRLLGTADREHSEVSLAELFEQEPPTAGIVEVLAYLQIAHDDGHAIDSSVHEAIVLPAPDGRRQVRAIVPRVRFQAHRREPVES